MIETEDYAECGAGAGFGGGGVATSDGDWSTSHAANFDSRAAIFANIDVGSNFVDVLCVLSFLRFKKC